MILEDKIDEIFDEWMDKIYKLDKSKWNKYQVCGLIESINSDIKELINNV